MQTSESVFNREITEFQENHKYQKIQIDDVTFDYLLCGNENASFSLVYLIGGLGLSVCWFNHIKRMESKFKILTFNYPMEINRLEQLADYTVQLVERLRLKNTIFIGASLGGFLGQIIARRYPDYIKGLVLYSTCSLSEKSIADLKKQYKSYGMLLKLMKIVPYFWIKNICNKASKKQVGLENESNDDKKYVEELFDWAYRGYTKTFDIHMTTLMSDLPKIKYLKKEDYSKIDQKTLLVLPVNDTAFTKDAQMDLINMMPRAQIVRVTGGHTATLFKVDKYTEPTMDFITQLNY